MSPVYYPAYEDTEVALRSIESIRDKERRDLEDRQNKEKEEREKRKKEDLEIYYNNLLSWSFETRSDCSTLKNKAFSIR